MSEINGHLGLSQQTESVSTTLVIPKGKFTLQMSTTNRSGVVVLPDEVTWHCAKRERLKCGVSDLLTFTLPASARCSAHASSMRRRSRTRKVDAAVVIVVVVVVVGGGGGGGRCGGNGNGGGGAAGGASHSLSRLWSLPGPPSPLIC